MNNRFKNNRMYNKGYKDGKEMSQSVLLEKINNLKAKFINGEIKAKDLQEKLNKLAETNEGLIERNEKLISAIGDLNEVIVEQQRRIEEEAQKNAVQKEQIEDLTKETNSLANELENLKNEQNDFNIELSDLKENMKNAFDELDEVKAYVDDKEKIKNFKHKAAEEIEACRENRNYLRMCKQSELNRNLLKQVNNTEKQYRDALKAKEDRIERYEKRSINAIHNQSGLSYALSEALFKELYK